MSQSSKTSRYGPIRPRKERRAPRGAPGSTRWLTGLLGRPVGLERRGGLPHLTLVERRRSPEVIEQQQRSRLCDDLRALLLDRGASHLTVMRHLVLVHELLAQRGWDAVGALASGVLRKALMQAQLLESHAAAPALSFLIERLRLLHVAAGLREDRQQGRPATLAVDTAEVTELTHEEFEARQRGDTDATAAHPPERVS